MRLVSFCFDDGFAATRARASAAFEARGLAATFCVLAAPELTKDEGVRACPIADWSAWRETQAAGHEVAPHGLAHERLSELTLEEACAGLSRTFEIFSRELPGFDPRRSLFHAAYLVAPQPLRAWLAERVFGIRMACGRDGLNRPGDLAPGGPVDCLTFGPDSADGLARGRIERFLAREEGWLVLVFHGVGEGIWGPLSLTALEALLDRLLEAGAVIDPASRAFGRLQAETRLDDLRTTRS